MAVRNYGPMPDFLVHRQRAWSHWWMWPRSVHFISEAIEGPADLAVHLRESLRQRVEGVSDDIDDVIEFGAHIGQFAVLHDRRAVSVLVLWFPLPEHRFWVLSIRPQRTRRQRRREQDLELASHVSSHLDEILADHPCEAPRPVRMTATRLVRT
jgi:hypothetical protein